MIEAAGLSKRFGGQMAVDDASFTCAPGTVTGFLGPNGAGKSTTLRMICGLAHPTAGTATVLGGPYRRIANPARHVGVMLDASAQHSGRTGRETLRLSAETMGVDRSRVPEWLERVGLDPSAAKKRVGKYSLGMRQRLGLAQVLIGEPQVLILDEPANGLDPQGIIWMRDLLRGFAQGGGTVLLSSHLLHEVDAIADQLVLINRGRIVAQGAKAELLATSGSYVRSPDRSGLERALHAAGIQFSASGDGLLADGDGERVGAAAHSGGVALSELRGADGGGLEQLFLSLTSDAGEPGTAPPPPPPGTTAAGSGGQPPPPPPPPGALS
ncbi:MAG: ATP-binding cassette domain-containing protein [Solirubrobacterales bacterium]|nr:ATP-binding cassette domain-containing protein [Thermoleophilales bacterium]MCO5327836.1 ATP-binding cassette domain-containing protein [Solirubrobacterales bacterium]